MRQIQLASNIISLKNIGPWYDAYPSWSLLEYCLFLKLNDTNVILQYPITHLCNRLRLTFSETGGGSE